MTSVASFESTDLLVLGGSRPWTELKEVIDELGEIITAMDQIAERV